MRPLLTAFPPRAGLRRPVSSKGPAEAIAETMREATATNGEDLATKTDLTVLEVRLKAEMSATANRVIVIILVALGTLFAALKLF